LRAGERGGEGEDQSPKDRGDNVGARWKVIAKESHRCVKDSVTLAEEATGMNPVVRMIGKVLRLVGISSPEDSAPKPKTAADPPSWRDSKGPKPQDPKG